MNITVQQEKEALRILKLLVKKSKDLLPKIELDLRRQYPLPAEIGGSWERLSLTRHGLRLYSGHYDRCTDPEGCMTTHEDTVNKPRELQPSIKVLREYELEVKALKKILKKLN